jgi:hypothetical protein
MAGVEGEQAHKKGSTTSARAKVFFMAIMLITNWSLIYHDFMRNAPNGPGMAAFE